MSIDDQNTYSSSEGGAAATPARVPEDSSESTTIGEARVNELRRKIAEGQYTVDSSQLAAKIVDKHLR